MAKYVNPIELAGALLRRFGPRVARGTYRGAKRAYKWAMPKARAAVVRAENQRYFKNGRGKARSTIYRKKRYSRKGRRRARPHKWRGSNGGPVQIDRRVDAGGVTSDKNKVAYFSHDFLTSTIAEGLLGNFIQIGETDAGAEREEKMDMGEHFTKKLYVMDSWQIFHLKNNTNYDINLCYYRLEPKVDGSVSATTSITSGLNDIQGGSGTVWLNDPLFYPQDSPTFRKRFWVTKTMKFTLKPGQTRKVYQAGCRNYTLGADWFDVHSALGFWPGLTTTSLFRYTGPIVHDSSDPTLVGVGNTALDIYYESYVKYQIVGGPRVRRDTHDNNLVTIAIPHVAQPDTETGEVFKP